MLNWPTPTGRKEVQCLRNFSSHVLTSPKSTFQWTSGNRELLVIKVALEEWRHWLEGASQPFLFSTGHKNLEHLRTAKRFNSQQARWALFFKRFHFAVSYQPGSKNTKPGALCRLFPVDKPFMDPAPILPPSCVVGSFTWDIEHKVMKANASCHPPAGSPLNRLFVPPTLRSQVIHWAHALQISHHPGVSRTMFVIR